VEDQIHVLNSCTDNMTANLLGGPSIYVSYPCFSAVTHSDGSLVTMASPAAPGENLSAYAFGMGVADVPVDVTMATPVSGVPVSRPFTISFTGIAPQDPGQPDYVGLVPGTAGLYIINFHAPAQPGVLAACDPRHPYNLTMTIKGTASMDQTSFCMQP
jgi:uncharacterized protein (TIGR03437 family)